MERSAARWRRVGTAPSPERFRQEDVEGALIVRTMTPAEVYRQRATEFFDLAAKSSDAEEREALRTFAFCCLQLERAEERRRQKSGQASEATSNECK
jgi:hypothetical protein